MSLPREVRAVVFDMDGLLFDSERLYFSAMVQAAEVLGRTVPPELFRSMVGLTSDGSRIALIGHYGDDFPVEAFWADSFRHFQALAQTQLCLKGGAVELLDHLDRLAMPRAIATSSSRRAVDHHLGGHGLAERFHAIVAHGDYARGKPNPDPYLVAAERLGVDPAHCLALEDSHNGVRAAAAAGMMTIMVPDMLEPTDEMHALCVRIAADLHEVAELLRG